MRKSTLKPRKGVTTVTGHRKPTACEVRYGHGAMHYAEFPVADWLKPDGTLKCWIVGRVDGLRYYR
jgi:hypothetical protein